MIHLDDTLGEIMASGKLSGKNLHWHHQGQDFTPIFYGNHFFAARPTEAREVKPRAQKHKWTPSPEDQVKSEH